MRIYALPVHFRCMGSIFYGGKTPFGVKYGNEDYMRTKSLLSLCLVMSGMSLAATQATFYVAPSGNDSNKGTEQEPFKTITQAQKAVRAINSSMTGDIEVILREGTYALPGTIGFDERDGGKDGHYVRYKAYDGEKPLITGGMAITGWTIHDEANGIWKAVPSIGYARWNSLVRSGSLGMSFAVPPFTWAFSRRKMFSDQAIIRWISTSSMFLIFLT